jgi:hypothetical protein
MNKYSCKACNYDTDRLFNYNKHKSSKKHDLISKLYINNNIIHDDNNESYNDNNNISNDDSNVNNDENNESNDEHKKKCNYCLTLISKSNMSRHYKSCIKYINHDTSADILLDSQKICRWCSKILDKSNISRHYNTCKQKDNNLKISQNNNELQSEIIKCLKNILDGNIDITTSF